MPDEILANILTNLTGKSDLEFLDYYNKRKDLKGKSSPMENRSDSQEIRERSSKELKC